MKGDFTRWIVFVVVWILSDKAKGDTIKGRLSSDAQHHRIVIVVPTQVRHVNHIHHYPAKGHKTNKPPNQNYPKRPYGPPTKSDAKCNHAHGYPGKGRPVYPVHKSPPSYPPKTSTYDEGKGGDYSHEPPEGTPAPPGSHEDKGYYDENYSGPGQEEENYDVRTSDKPTSDKDTNGFSYNGHGAPGSGSFRGLGQSSPFRTGKYSSDFNIPLSHGSKFNSGFNHGFDSGGFPGSGNDGRITHQYTQKETTKHQYGDKGLKSDFPYRFSYINNPPIYKHVKSLPGSNHENESPAVTTAHSFNSIEDSSLKDLGYSTPAYGESYAKAQDEDTGTREVNSYEYVPYSNANGGPNDSGDHYFNGAEEPNNQLGRSSEEFYPPSGEFNFNSKNNAGGSSYENKNTAPVSNFGSHFDNDSNQKLKELAKDFAFLKTEDNPRNKIKNAYVNSPYSFFGHPTPAPAKGNDIRIEKQNLIRLKPIISSAEFSSPIFPQYSKVIGHGRALFPDKIHDDFTFDRDSQIDDRFEYPFEPHKLQSKTVVRGVPRTNGSQAKPVVLNIKDRIHQMHGYVPRKETRTIIERD